jgi:hypothetical protein
MPNGDFGNGRHCRALEKQPQFRMKPFAARRREGVKVKKSRHDPVSGIAASRSWTLTRDLYLHTPYLVPEWNY